MRSFLFAVLASIVVLVGQQARAEDWPRFHGPRNDNISRETGLLKQWPNGGPELLWTADGLGFGYSTVAIADGMIHTAGVLDEKTYVLALDMRGEHVWRTPNGEMSDRSYPGSRGTPTVDDGRVFHLNAEGNLVCLDAKTGESIWEVDILERFEGSNIFYGLSESLLIDGDHVICTPGGEKAGVAALDKRTGETVWTCGEIGEQAAYCSPLLVEHDGLRQIVTMTASSAVGVHAKTGKLLWRYPHPMKLNVNIATPIFRDGHLALFGSWGRGTTKLKLCVDGQACDVEEVWRTRGLDNEHGGVVLVDGFLYGHADGKHTYRHWACLDWETGRQVYDETPFGRQRSGATAYADGMLYLMGEDREVALVPATPDQFEVISQFQIPKGGVSSTWAHPVIHGGRLYIRHGEFLYAFDIKEK